MRNKKLTHEEFVKKIYDLVGDEYSVESSYKGSKEKVLFKHNVCSSTFEKLSGNFIRGQRCQKCNNKRYWDTERFSNKVKELCGDEYIVIGDYEANNKPLKMIHTTCGKEIEMRPANFLNGARCLYCFGNPKKNTEDFKKELELKYNGEYLLVGEYVNSKTHVLVKHVACGREWHVAPANLLNGYLCTKCNGYHRRTHEEFLQEIYFLVKDKYTVLEEFKGVDTKLKMRHNECGNICEISPYTFIKVGVRCTNCSMSKGEIKVRDYLKNNNLDFIYEKEFEGLLGVGNKNLSYDFYIPILNLLIEYQGVFHDGGGCYFTKENLEKQQEHDRRKREFARKNNIHLLEIWYYDYDSIDSILDEFINNKIEASYN